VSGANNNLTGLMNAINNANAGVTASIINTGSGDYLTLTANNVGATTLQLNGVPQQASLLTNTGSGTETSLYGYSSATTTPVSNSGTVDLSVGGGSAIQLNVSGANNNLTGLMNAINNANAGVTASLTTKNGQNYLQLTSSSGPTSITLDDQAASTPVDLITNSDQGTDASFTLNGNIQVTNQPTNTFTSVIPGVSFTLLQNDSGSVNISLSADPTQLASALQNLTTDYNTLMTDVNQQIGTNAGPLAGNTIIDTISDDLRQLTAYWLSNSTSSVRSLFDLGITFNDTTGQMSFDASVVDNFNSSQMADAFKFLGSSNSGFAALASNFTQVSDPATGMIEVQEQGYQTDDTNLENEISTDNNQITTMQTNMTTQLEAADALVDQLQSEQSQVQAEVESVDYVDFGAPLNSNQT